MLNLVTRKSDQIMVIEDLCDLDKCTNECISICPVNKRNQDSPAIKIENKAWIDQVNCVNCGKCIKACPINAIHGEKSEQHSDYIPPAIDNPIDLEHWYNEPYVLDRDYFVPFSQRNVIFARVFWDEQFNFHQKFITYNEHDIIRLNRKGYSKVEFAQVSAAWTVYDYFDGAQRYLPYREPEKEKYKVEDAQLMTDQLKQVAMANGAALVGVAELKRDWIYTNDRENTAIDIPEHMNRVIVMAIEMDLDAINTSPHLTACFATGNAYSRMAFTQNVVAEFIRALGYDAVSGGNGVGRSVPFAIEAGLGEYGRHGLLITEKYGSSVRLCKIITDLPLIPDKPVSFGVHNFCRVCKKCAETCPSQSISHDDDPTWVGPTISNNNGILKYYVNPETCYEFWVQNGGECSNCISSCPFTKHSHWTHDLVRFIIKHFPFMNKFMVKMDDLLGYGKQRDSAKFWKKDRKFIHTRGT